jgi:hypothetical protein
MNKKRAGAVFVALLMCGLVSQASAQDAEPKFNSNADDITKIRGVLEEFRQDIIRKDGYALTKLVLNPDVLFHHTNTRKRLIAPANTTLSSMGSVPASSMDLRNFSLRRKTNSKRDFAISRFARTVL